MTYTVPGHTPYQWHDSPSNASPIDAANLNAAQADLVTYIQSVATGLDAYLEPLITGTVANVLSYGAKGDGVTDNTTAIQNAVNFCIAAGGGMVYFPAGVYVVASLAGISLGGAATSVTLVGDTRDRSIIKWTATCTGLNPLIAVGTGQALTLQSLTLLGTTSLANGGPSGDPGLQLPNVGRSNGVICNGTTGSVRAVNCAFTFWVTALTVNTPTTLASIEAEDCIFTGCGATFPSMIVSTVDTGSGSYAPGKRVKMKNCTFTAYGDAAGTSFYHGIYAYTDWDLDIEDCLFVSPVAGCGPSKAIKHGDNTVTGANAAMRSNITNCQFALLGNSYAIQTSDKTETKVSDCTFPAVASRAMNVTGPVQIDNCTFTTTTSASDTVILTAYGDSGSTGALTIGGTISNCRFRMLSSGGTNAVKLGNGDAATVLTVSNCDFSGGGASQYVLAFGGSLSAAARLVVDGCTFSGTAQFANIQGASPCNLTVSKNLFATTNANCVQTSAVLTSLVVLNNDISNDAAGNVFALGSTPTRLTITGNYGSIGFPTRAGGTATITSGVGTPTVLNIPHGLGNASLAVTPTMAVVSPGNALSAALAHPPAVTMTSTNIVLTFAAATLAPSTGYAWTWSAER